MQTVLGVRDLVEIGEAGIAVDDAMRRSVVFDWMGGVLGLTSCKRSFENMQAFNPRNPLAAFNMPAAVQRSAIAAFCHRLTLRQTRRTVPIMFSIELVPASERGALPVVQGGAIAESW
jgi:hypothetical protein